MVIAFSNVDVSFVFEVLGMLSIVLSLFSGLLFFALRIKYKLAKPATARLKENSIANMFFICFASIVDNNIFKSNKLIPVKYLKINKYVKAWKVIIVANEKNININLRERVENSRSNLKMYIDRDHPTMRENA